MTYIKVPAIFNKLKQAAKDNRILYVSGSVGMGKTAAAQYYFRRKSARFLQEEDGTLAEMPPLDEIREEAVVVDGLSALQDHVAQDYICELIEEKERPIVLIGRGSLPPWLAVAATQHEFLFASNSDLELSEEDVQELFVTHTKGYKPDSEELQLILERTHHNTLLLLNVARHLPKEETFIDQYLHPAQQDLFHYMDQAFLDPLPSCVRSALLQIGQFESFDIELLRQITAEPRSDALLDKMIQLGDFVAPAAQGRYILQPIYRDYLLWKTKIEYNAHQITEIYGRAAVYYELNDRPLEAMECYRNANYTDRLISLLSRNVEKHPGQERFRSLIPFYDAIPDERIAESPVLMAGRSICSSLAMDPKKSEYWYGKLEEYAGKQSTKSHQYREAVSRLAFLDLTLPHRDKSELIEKLESLSSMPTAQKETTSSVQSLIDNVPSLIGGSVELSDLLCKYSEVLQEEEGYAAVLQEKIESVFGTQATGFTDMLLAEYLYERDQLNSLEYSEIVNQAYVQAEASGAHEMAFVACTLLVRNYLDSGKYDLGKNLFDNYKKKCENNGVNFLRCALDMFSIYLDLLKGETKSGQKWLERSLNEDEVFSILDRQKHLMKIRLLITLQRTDEAMLLADRLIPAFKTYHRPHDLIQVLLMKATLLHRQNLETWKATLKEALTLAEQYGYIHLVADGGAPLQPLLQEWDGKGVSKKFLDAVKKWNDKRTLYFPNYMRMVEALKEPLTEMEHKVIRLMCSELPSENICDMLSISYSGLKFHRQNIYRKFRVNNRHDAQRVAKGLGLNLPQ